MGQAQEKMWHKFIKKVGAIPSKIEDTRLRKKSIYQPNCHGEIRHKSLVKQVRDMIDEYDCRNGTFDRTTLFLVIRGYDIFGGNVLRWRKSWL